MELIGKVVWYDTEDGCGQIRDSQGRTFYFDSSVIDPKALKKIKSKQLVLFKMNKKVKDCLCACRITVPVESQKKKIARNYQAQKQMELFT